MIRGQSFPRSARLRLQRDFAGVIACKCSTADARLIVYVDQNGGETSRLGVSVSKRIGTAVKRHRVKRLIREAFRLSRAELPGGLDIVCVARSVEATVDAYRASLSRLVNTAVRKLESRRAEPRTSVRADDHAD